MIYHFGECALDTQLYSITRGGKSIRMRPKVFRVCLYLLQHRDRVVTREELCTQVWAGQFISQTTLEGVIRSVRQAVGDSGHVQGIVQTLRGYGYRFVAAVEECPARRLEEALPVAAALPRTLGEAVLPQSASVSAGVAAGQEPEVTIGSERQSEASWDAPRANGHGVNGRAGAGLEGQPAAHSPAHSRQRVHGVGLAAAVMLLALLAGWGLWQSLGRAPAGPPVKTRLAVLPFLDLSVEADQAYFADGMTEELITQLSQIHGLTVIARTSVMQYKGTRKDVATIGRELGVGTLLEGSVRRVDHQVRISAQLIDVASQSHVWAQEYDRELTGVFDIQRDIATRVAQRLKVQFGTDPVVDRSPADPRFASLLQKLRPRQ